MMSAMGTRETCSHDGANYNFLFPLAIPGADKKPTLTVPRRLHTHLTSCSTEFALRSEPSRRCVPQRPRWARRPGPRVLRSNLAEPERRLARWMLA